MNPAVYSMAEVQYCIVPITHHPPSIITLGKEQGCCHRQLLINAMKYQTLKLLASSPLIVGFVPPLTNNYRLQYVHDKCNIHGFVDASSKEGSRQQTNHEYHSFVRSSNTIFPAVVSGTQSSSSSLFAVKSRASALFAKPRARLDAEDDEDDLDYADDEDEEEEDGE